MSLPRYGQYERSGVAWLPEVPAHWECMRLGTLFREVNESGNDDLPILSVSIHDGVSDKELDEGESDRKVTRSDDRSKYKAVAPGDLTYNMMRAWQGGFGSVTVRGMVSPAYVVARPRMSFSTEVVEMLLRTPNAVAEMKRHSRGITEFRLRLYWEDFKDIRVVLPPIEEQTRILAFIARETAKIDSLVAEQEKLIALLAEKRQAIISEAVMHGLNRDVPMQDVSIGTVPAHWKVGPLKRYWSVTDCKHITAEFVEDGFPLASIREVQSTYVSLTEAKKTTRLFYEQLIEGERKPLAGDLIFSRNATVGEVAQVTEEHPAFAMGQDVCLLRRMSPAHSAPYLQAVIRSPVVVEQLKNLMIGSTFKRVNVEEIRSLVVPMPPPQEQAQIARFVEAEVSKLEMVTSNAVRGIELLKERRSALITAAVTGQIDVRNAVPHPAAEPEPLPA